MFEEKHARVLLYSMNQNECYRKGAICTYTGFHEAQSGKFVIQIDIQCQHHHPFSGLCTHICVETDQAAVYDLTHDIFQQRPGGFE